MTAPRVLVACEFSGIVRDAFRARGFDAWSCDLLETEAEPSTHLIGDVRDFIGGGFFSWGWDLLIAHPPCTYLAVSGARWFKGREQQQADALEFVRQLMDAPIAHIAIENPVSVISTRIRKPDQIIQPWQFGHPETKATCLWLKGLPHLTPTEIVEGRHGRVHREAPSPDRWKNRSRTLKGDCRGDGGPVGRRAASEQGGRMTLVSGIALQQPPPTAARIENSGGPA